MAKQIRRPSWYERFMGEALDIATRSSCNHLKSGAVIVRDKRVISSGYNGAPQDIRNCLERGCRKDKKRIPFDVKGTGTCRGVHAEINALSMVTRDDTKGATMFSVRYPCSACAKAIVNYGIREVVYARGYEERDSLTEELFREARVRLVYFTIPEKRLREMDQLRRDVHYG